VRGNAFFGGVLLYFLTLRTPSYIALF